MTSASSAPQRGCALLPAVSSLPGWLLSTWPSFAPLASASPAPKRSQGGKRLFGNFSQTETGPHREGAGIPGGPEGGEPPASGRRAGAGARLLTCPLPPSRIHPAEWGPWDWCPCPGHLAHGILVRRKGGEQCSEHSKASVDAAGAKGVHSLNQGGPATRRSAPLSKSIPSPLGWQTTSPSRKPRSKVTQSVEGRTGGRQHPGDPLPPVMSLKVPDACSRRRLT